MRKFHLCSVWINLILDIHCSHRRRTNTASSLRQVEIVIHRVLTRISFCGFGQTHFPFIPPSSHPHRILMEYYVTAKTQVLAGWWFWLVTDVWCTHVSQGKSKLRMLLAGSSCHILQQSVFQLIFFGKNEPTLAASGHKRASLCPLSGVWMSPQARKELWSTRPYRLAGTPWGLQQQHLIRGHSGNHCCWFSSDIFFFNLIVIK